MTTYFHVPIYDCKVWVSALPGQQIKDERKEHNCIFGADEDQSWQACCEVGKDKSFGLFFDTNKIDVGLIAHEVFHLTHFILNEVGASFDPNDHEPAALLHEWLFKKVLEVLDQGSVKYE